MHMTKFGNPTVKYMVYVCSHHSGLVDQSIYSVVAILDVYALVDRQYLGL